MTSRDVNETPHLQETANDVPDSCKLSNRKGGDTINVIIIPVETANYIMGQALHAFVSTKSIEDMENALIYDGGATCTLTKSLENCTPCKQKVARG